MIQTFQKAVQIKVYRYEQPKNSEAIGVRWLDTAFTHSLSFQIEGESCVKPQHSKIR